jgi:HEAT repeat protein
VDVRIRSALALWKVSGDAGRAVPVLRAALTPESAYHIRDAIRALGEIGPAARSALPDLEALSGDPDEWVRKDAREAAERIAGRIPLPDPARR